MPSHQVTPDLASGRSCPDVSEHAWYLPEAEGGQDRLNDWCRTVGPPVLSPEPTANFGDLASGDTLTVVSWNIDVGGGDVPAVLETELGLACDGRSSRLAPGADHFVLLVQEAFRRSNDIPETPPGATIPRAVAEGERPGERLDAVEVATRCGLSLVYVAAARNGREPNDGKREDKGVAILSTLPLENVFFIELPYEAARRVAASATVRDESGRSDALDQAEAAGDPISTLLAGDFNTWSDRETTLLRLRERFPDSPPPLEEGTHGAFPTDHILFRGGSGGVALLENSYARLSESYYSDHHPIQVRVHFAE
jgi:endonuclease/exonuclease/phosphatase family metal-dependent hydrolase